MKSIITLAVLSAVSVTSFANGYGPDANTANEVSSAPFAQHTGPLSYTVSATATTNLVDGNETLSGHRPSVYVSGATRLATSVGTFGVEASAAKVYNTVSDVRTDLFLTYGTRVNGVDLLAKIGTEHFGGTRAKSQSTENLILAAAYKGAFISVDKTIVNRANTGFDLSEKIGYTTNLNYKLDVTVATVFNQYQAKDTTKYNYSEIDVNYKVTQNVVAGIQAVFLSKNIKGQRQAPQLGANVTYSF